MTNETKKTVREHIVMANYFVHQGLFGDALVSLNAARAAISESMDGEVSK